MRPIARRMSSCVVMINLLSTAGRRGLYARASAHRSRLLGADEGDQITPIGVTQPAQGTNLELIIRPWSQVAHRYRLRTGQRHVHPNGRSARCRYGAVM